jgi:hypothetical protein
MEPNGHKPPPAISLKPIPKAADKEISKVDVSKSTKALNKAKIDGLRRSVFDTVAARLKDASEVLEGKQTWSNQQVRLFTAMLDKVLPDLQHKHNSFSDERDITKLSRAQLEEIARRAMPGTKEPKVIDVDSTDAESGAGGQDE